MTFRAPAQALLAERLERVKGARHVVLRAPVGSGVTGALVPIIQRSAAAGLVLIMSPRRVVLDHWGELLQSHNVDNARFVTPDIALEMASGQLRTDHTGVLLTTPASLRRGPARAWLSSADVALFVVDSVPRDNEVALPAVVDIANRARQTIVVDHDVSASLPQWLDKPSLATLTLEDLITLGGGRRTDPETYSVAISKSEIAILHQSATILREQGAVRNRVASHSALVQLIGTSSTSEGDIERVRPAWRLVDKLESLGPDPRLAAMVEVVNRKRSAGPVIVVAGNLRAEIEYVRDYLMANGIQTDHWSRHDASESRGDSIGPPYPVIVASPSGLEVDETPLSNATLVYFTAPDDSDDKQWLTSALIAGTARSAVLPVTDVTSSNDDMKRSPKSLIERIDQALIDLPEIRPGADTYIHRLIERGWWLEGELPIVLLQQVVVDVAAALYSDQVGQPVELLEFSAGAFEVLFDRAHERTVLMHGVTRSTPSSISEEKYPRRFPGRAGSDRGHAMAHARGGREGGPNDIPQVPQVNRRLSPLGALWRDIDSYVAVNPDSFCFVRLVYPGDVSSDVPAEVEYGVLAEGQFRTVIFPNSGLP